MISTTSDWQARDASHLLHAFHELGRTARPPSRIIASAEHIWLTDSDGHRMLDGMSGLWCVHLGYGERALVDAAARQMAELPFASSASGSASRRAVELAGVLAELAPAGMRRVFFTNSGSEAMETALRLVRRYWVARGAPRRRIVIGRVGGYHGSTLAAAAVGGIGAMHLGGALSDVAHIGAPHLEQRVDDASAERHGLEAARWLEAKVHELGAENVAAFVGEPVMGASGVLVPPRSYWPEVRRICDRHGILLVSDEVVCGFGRSGAWFGCQALGYRPDILTFSKGVNSGYLPLGGVLLGDHVGETLAETGGHFPHGFTCSGHPVACAVALANIGLMRERGLVDRVRDHLGPHFAGALRSLHGHPLVSHSDAMGLMGALVLDPTACGILKRPQPVPAGMRCVARAAEAGLIVRSVGPRLIIAPPLVITPAEIDDLVHRLRRALDGALKDLQRGDGA